jgi:hypothetical protein
VLIVAGIIVYRIKRVWSVGILWCLWGRLSKTKSIWHCAEHKIWMTALVNFSHLCHAHYGCWLEVFSASTSSCSPQIVTLDKNAGLQFVITGMNPKASFGVFPPLSGIVQLTNSDVWPLGYTLCFQNWSFTNKHNSCPKTNIGTTPHILWPRFPWHIRPQFLYFNHEQVISYQ